MPINQPSGSIKLTNISLVRMRKGKTTLECVYTKYAKLTTPIGKKRFEIACYQNKVQDWRKGV